MYRLYWDARTGALAPQAMLEEMSIPWERIPVDMAAGEHRGSDYLRINPAGQVPTLELPDGRVMTESAAMVLLLGERHPDGGLVPGAQDPDRPEFLQWLMFMATSVYSACAGIYHSARFTTDAEAVPSIRQGAIHELERLFALLDGAIAGDPWFLPRGYSALDIYLAMLADWHPEPEALLRRVPAVRRLCAAAEQRDVFARVMTEHRD